MIITTNSHDRKKSDFNQNVNGFMAKSVDNLKLNLNKENTFYTSQINNVDGSNSNQNNNKFSPLPNKKLNMDTSGGLNDPFKSRPKTNTGQEWDQVK